MQSYDRRPTTGHQIAKVMKARWSRATTYRKLKKCEQLGLIAYTELTKVPQWYVTQRGQEFKDNYNELPF